MFEKPPYTITEKTADCLAKIVEAILRLEFGTDFKRDIRLHRVNRLRTIHASLAIEGNTLSLDEMTAVIEGKVLAGKQDEVKEVKNAYTAYGKLLSYNPYSVRDFLRAHKLMTQGLIEESGIFRSGEVGVFAGGRAVHFGARPQFVPQLVKSLFDWAKASELHPVLKSAVIHYEIETIHPFADGNRRIGRLWQTLLLAKWNAVFAWVPMETLIFQTRPQYYQAIRDARQAVELSDAQRALLAALKDMPLSRKEIFSAIGLSVDSRASRRVLDPLLAADLIEMTLPDKPNNAKQKYRLTETGREIAQG
ncbi:MAG: Fic family protein [Proteobacteria bacterium]|nr:Fic family protein [Pseudomonadota bacterium]